MIFINYTARSPVCSAMNESQIVLYCVSKMTRYPDNLPQKPSIHAAYRLSKNYVHS